jgi:hypothetical protein
MLILPRTHFSRNSADRRVSDAEPDEVVDLVGVGRELADGQRSAVQRQRRNHGVHPAAVRQSGVHHGAGLVDPSTHPGHDLVDGATQVRLVVEPGVDRVDLARPLDPHRVVPVDHHLGDVRVPEERLDRAVAQDVVGDLLRDARPVGHRQRGLLAGEHLLQRDAHLLLELGLGEPGVVELRTEGLQQLLVDLALEIGEWVRHLPLARCARCRLCARSCVVDDGAVTAGGRESVGKAHQDLLRRKSPRERWLGDSPGDSRVAK